MAEASGVQDPLPNDDLNEDLSVGSLASVSSPFILEIKEQINEIIKILEHESNVNKKISVKSASTLKELNLKIFLRCVEAEAELQRSRENISSLRVRLEEKSEECKRTSNLLADVRQFSKTRG